MAADSVAFSSIKFALGQIGDEKSVRYSLQMVERKSIHDTRHTRWVLVRAGLGASRC
jgi:hypothetical protein